MGKKKRKILNYYSKMNEELKKEDERVKSFFVKDMIKAFFVTLLIFLVQFVLFFLSKFYFS